MKLKKDLKDKLIKIIIIVAILLFAAFFINGKVKEANYRKTYEYKLLEKSYTKDETTKLIKSLKNNELNYILKIDYNKEIISFINERYFIFNNLEKYLDYYNKNKNINKSEIINLVNVHRDYDFYENTQKANISLNELMLVNKYYSLDETYMTDDIVEVSSQYAYEGNSLKEVAYQAFKSLYDDAKNEGLKIIINSSYRSFESQSNLWKTRETYYGEEKADAYAARAGFSEHQTGLAIDVSTYRDTQNDFSLTQEYLWMVDNSYKYGFILRYPEGKENITGYSYEPWHYRYVGKEVALKIKELNITFDEYYAYYIEK